MQDINLDDDGFQNITINGVLVNVDIWKIRTRLQNLYEKYKNNLNDEKYLEDILDIMQEIGFPKVSHRLAEKFAITIYEIADQIKKK